VIVVDTSALMALLLSEPCGDDIADVLVDEAKVVISAGTLAEALIVAGRRGLSEEMEMLLSGIGIEVENLSASGARAVAGAYAVWGKGVHPTGLNFGDCFAYVTARSHGAALLFVGEDFSRTDVASALKS
jgi:ribonuclease VapC